MQTTRRPRSVLDERKSHPSKISPLQRHQDALGLFRQDENRSSFNGVRLERFGSHRPNDRTLRDTKNDRVFLIEANIRARARSLLRNFHRGRFDDVA